MPNWVFNNLTIEGDSDTIAQVKERLAKPIVAGKYDWQTKETTYAVVTPVLSFLNIDAPPPEKMEEYHGIHGFADGQKQGQTEYNWYNWNNAHWGTKWDVDAEIIHETPTKITYRFDTAWAPPQTALSTLSTIYPNLKISNEWEEEQGFGATHTYSDGTEIEEDGYNWKCAECDYLHPGDPNEIYDEEQDGILCPECENLSL